MAQCAGGSCHPDDETFGPGAVIDAMVGTGSAVHVLCFTHGEASPVNRCGADLRTARAAELRLACGSQGGDDGGCRGGRPARAGLDHRETVAGQLRAETGAKSVGRPDICVRADRARQRRAGLLHASQISPASVLWRRLELRVIASTCA